MIVATRAVAPGLVDVAWLAMDHLAVARATGPALMAGVSHNELLSKKLKGQAPLLCNRSPVPVAGTMPCN